MGEYTVHKESDPLVWDSFVRDSPQGTIFCESKFLSALSVSYSLYIVSKGKETVGGCVILESETGEALSAPFDFTPYQGFLFKDYTDSKPHKKNEDEYQVSQSLVSFLSERYQKFSLAHSPSVIDMRPFLWHNYGKAGEPHFLVNVAYTPILTTKDLEKDEILLLMKQSRRQEYTKVEKSLVIEEGSDVELLNTLHYETFLRQGIERSPRQEHLLKSITKKSLQEGYGRLLIGYSNGAPASAVFFIFDQRRAYYLFGATDPKFRNSTAATKLLIDQVLHSALDKKLCEVDFVGCNSPERGYYKLSFGGALSPYFEVSLIR